jgi:hypothetical protein
MKKKQSSGRGQLLAIMLVIAIVLFAESISAASPNGASINFIGNSTKNASTAGFRNESKGTISTVILSTFQQDYKWKAYVGNVTSTFTLDDSADQTIYQWNMDSFTGRIFATRTSTAPTWSAINCSNASQKANEDTALNHNSTKTDSINRTFTARTHKAFSVAGKSIPASDCFAIATWINDTTNTLSTTASFQELLLNDGANMVYTTFVENDVLGYRNDSITYDFQMILPEDATITNPNIAYYFYLDLE